MKIPKEVMKCVVFLCIRRIENGKESFVPIGTAFFVSVPSEVHKGLHYLYIVTAKHIIEKSGGSELFLRINDKGGNAMHIGVTGGFIWQTHPEDAKSSIDVAVIGFDLPVEVDIMAVPLQMFLTQENIENGDVDIGHDVFITGLFSQHHGTFGNLPIVRMGNIAMLPGQREKVSVSWHNASIDAYLIESRSIGGLSGSPVFFLGDPSKSRKFYLGGLIHGHWSIDSSLIDSDDAMREEKNINMGIAIVIPAEKIKETLLHEELNGYRKEKDAVWLKG